MHIYICKCAAGLFIVVRAYAYIQYCTPFNDTSTGPLPVDADNVRTLEVHTGVYACTL